MLGPIDYLARAHHQRQGQEALAATQVVRRGMASVDLRDRRQVGRAVDTIAPTLLQRRARSIGRSREFYGRARLIGVGSDQRPDVPVEDSEEQLRSSLYIVARGRLVKRTSERGYARAREMAVDEMAGVAVRHVLDGGRSNVIEMSRRDERAMGFVRMTAQDERVCALCAMLASREDYKANSFARSDARFIFGGNPLANAKVHDRCRCSIRPVFYGEATPDYTERARALWYELSEGDGREAFLSFRRNWEARLRQGTSVWQAA